MDAFSVPADVENNTDLTCNEVSTILMTVWRIQVLQAVFTTTNYTWYNASRGLSISTCYCYI